MHLSFAKTSTETKNETVVDKEGLNPILARESRSELGGSIVTMVQSAESLLSNDLTGSYRTNPAIGRPHLG